jgi:hypothetical protein
MRILITLIAVLATANCRTTDAGRPGDRFWQALSGMCGKSFEGRLVEGTEPSDAAIGAQRLVMHVQSCSADEIRVPFHVGSDRSRTWVITRTPDGLRLKHDHRHEDGTPDAITQYGGDTRAITDELRLDFFADEMTGKMLPASASNIWTLSIDGDRFSYALRRETSGRRFRVEFDTSLPLQ